MERGCPGGNCLSVNDQKRRTSYKFRCNEKEKYKYIKQKQKTKNNRQFELKRKSNELVCDIICGFAGDETFEVGRLVVIGRDTAPLRVVGYM